MQTRLLTLTLAAPRATAFNFLADIENLPAWTGGLCEWVELHREGWWAYTALGELAVETKVDDIAGVIDLSLRHVSGWSLVIPLRVRSDGEGGALVHAACRQTAGLTDEHYERLFEALLTGLRELPAQLHPELAVA
ncbi:hypothetical protein Verru16b_00401 [Lacunisphaera limnophila]|uniref:Polyketide cyclase / dehydrase and lipid transport n=1 Tax=Lacunisphaera limnophila TaxID=1838286 RepID=A0A1D8AR52_9BACT|nr:hypothetical protein [Lacunisphaera limnophila]AOS43358.1 hypothetical protein Verru16b_00401 [Lacunisphaera limnophila]